MTPQEPPPTGPAAAPAGDPRLRRIWRIVGAGVLLGVGLAVLSGVLGADGRVGFVILFLVLALATGAAALYGGLTAVVDDLKGRRVARARVISVVGLFLLTAVLMALVAGAGG